MTALSALGPMKLMGLLNRREDLSLEQFSDHWRTTHKVEALKLTQFLTGYIQNHRYDQPLPGFKNVADGCPELWFEKAEDIAAMQTSDEYMTGAYIDEPNFMDGRSAGIALQERTIIPGPVAAPGEAMLRVNVFLTATDKAALAEELADTDSPAVSLSVPPVRHCRGIALQVDEDPPLYDAMESYWWPDMETFERAWGEGYIATEFAQLIDQPYCAGLLTKELRVIWPEDGVDYGM